MKGAAVQAGDRRDRPPRDRGASHAGCAGCNMRRMKNWLCCQTNTNSSQCSLGGSFQAAASWRHSARAAAMRLERSRTRTGQPPQWHRDESGEGLGWRGAAGGAAQPGLQLRARAGQEGPDLDRRSGQDHRALCCRAFGHAVFAAQISALRARFMLAQGADNLFVRESRSLHCPAVLQRLDWDDVFDRAFRIEQVDAIQFALIAGGHGDLVFGDLRENGFGRSICASESEYRLLIGQVSSQSLNHGN